MNYVVCVLIGFMIGSLFITFVPPKSERKK
jgi:hypothetical protein